MNSSNIIVTEMNDDIVFLLYPFNKNNIIILIIIHITRGGIVGLNPHPTIIRNMNSKAKLIYLVRNVFIPLLPPIIVSSISNIRDSSFIII